MKYIVYIAVPTCATSTFEVEASSQEEADKLARQRIDGANGLRWQGQGADGLRWQVGKTVLDSAFDTDGEIEIDGVDPLVEPLG